MTGSQAYLEMAKTKAAQCSISPKSYDIVPCIMPKSLSGASTIISL